MHLKAVLICTFLKQAEHAGFQSALVCVEHRLGSPVPGVSNAKLCLQGNPQYEPEAQDVSGSEDRAK